MDYTVVVSAPSSEPAPLQYIAPYAGAALAEYFMYQGKHTLAVYDDLSKQAIAYRQLALLMPRPPGGRAFPRHLFYCPSRLPQQATNLPPSFVVASLPALPPTPTPSR